MELDVSRRRLMAIGGLGALAALDPLDIVRRGANTTAFAAGTTALSTTAVFPWIRDRIVINQAWEQELRLELTRRNVLPGTTVLLLAREIVHQQDYAFKLAGFPLVVAADTYDGRNGAIDTTRYAASGSTAASITLLARNVVWARLVAKGMNGYDGSDGEQGGPGEPAEFEFIDGKPVCLSPGGRGEPGGSGEPGQNGGNGGAITVYSTSVPGPLVFDASAGTGGEGGQGGPGGPGGAGGGGCPAEPGCRAFPAPTGFPAWRASSRRRS